MGYSMSPKVLSVLQSISSCTSVIERLDLNPNKKYVVSGFAEAPEALDVSVCLKNFFETKGFTQDDLQSVYSSYLRFLKYYMNTNSVYSRGIISVSELAGAVSDWAFLKCFCINAR